MSDTDDALLRAAVEKLRTVADGASPAPWGTARSQADTRKVHVNVGNGGRLATVRAADGLFMAAMNPAIARAVANWLEAEAERVGFAALLGETTPAMDVAIELARLVVGSDDDAAAG